MLSINQAIEEYSSVNKRKQRARKEIREYFYEKHKESNLYVRERWSVNLLKMALSKAERPVISCSFGIDSVVTIYLVRKALKSLGREPSDIDIVWNDTLNEFPEVRKFSKMLVEKWNLRLIKTTPDKSLRNVIDDHGGLDSSYFTTRKGDRRHGKPLSEKCCDNLKHKPMNKAIKENDWDLVINGLRADESLIRFNSAMKDGEYFYSNTTWKSFMCRPILWWEEKHIWEYVYLEKIPYNELYDKNLIRKYPNNINALIRNYKNEFRRIKLNTTKLLNEELVYVDRRQAILLSELGFEIFMPRTGCMMCPIPIKYGYLQWMRLNKPKVYHAMIFNLGYGEALKDLLPDDVKEEIEEIFNINIQYDELHEHLKEILEYKPCLFDNLNKVSQPNEHFY